MSPNDPHRGARVLRRGPEPADARFTVLAAHGRGGSPEDLLGLAEDGPGADVSWIAPAAAGSTWYPARFTAPLERNEPWLSSALALLDRLLDELAADGPGPERTVLLGFSQGGCLALEYAVRNPRRYGGVVGWSAGLIGPEGTEWWAPEEGGGFEGTPAFLGCADVDPHIPLQRVRDSAAVFERAGARTTVRIYPGMGHAVNADEVAWLRALLGGASGEGRGGGGPGAAAHRP